jgi:hypothetical protein
MKNTALSPSNPEPPLALAKVPPCYSPAALFDEFGTHEPTTCSQISPIDPDELAGHAAVGDGDPGLMLVWKLERRG